MSKALEGKNIVLLIRNLKDEATKAAEYILFQTEYSKTISKAIDEQVTKSGTQKTSGESSTEISTTALAKVNDEILDALEDGMHTDEEYGFWEINKAVKGSGGADANKFKAIYYEGKISNYDFSAPAEGKVEVTLDLAIDGHGQRGFATLTEEQAEFVQYVFKDTVAITG